MLHLVKPDDPILRRVCRPDFTVNMRDIMQMFALLQEHDGLGLAASQVGIDARLFVTACPMSNKEATGRWSRLEGTTPVGGSDEARPHFIPKTAIARNLVGIDAGGFIGTTGLCPGEVTLDDGSKTLAYRFLAGFPEAEAKQLMDHLDEIIRDLERAAHED